MNRAKAQSASYGLDAPGVLRGLLVAAALLVPAGWIAGGRERQKWSFAAPA